MKKPDILFETVAGSHAYGLATKTSDTDMRGIFLGSNKDIILRNVPEQYNDEKQDIIHYELNRAVNLLSTCNPNMLEMLYIDKKFWTKFDKRILPLFDNKSIFLTKQIRISFGGYAISQIKKSRGTNKKIVNPMSEELKPISDFCTVIPLTGANYITLTDFMKQEGLQEQYIGLSKIDKGNQLYKVFYDYIGDMEVDNPKFVNMLPDSFKGLRREIGGLICSSIPKSLPPIGVLSFDLNGYESYLREYKDYHEWVKKRNPHRYNANIANAHNYDGKNMMHCIRLLETSIDAFRTGTITPLVKNRAELMKIRNGLVPYEEVLAKAEELVFVLDEEYNKSSLPESVKKEDTDEIISIIREI